MYLRTPSSNPSSLVSVIRNVAILPTSGSISAWGETSLRSKGTSPSLGRSPSLLTTPPSPPRRGVGASRLVAGTGRTARMPRCPPPGAHLPELPSPGTAPVSGRAAGRRGCGAWDFARPRPSPLPESVRPQRRLLKPEALQLPGSLRTPRGEGCPARRPPLRPPPASS